MQRRGFPGDPVVKNLLGNAGDARLITGWGRSPGEGDGNLIEYPCLEIPWTEEAGGLQAMGLLKKLDLT